MTRLTFEGVDQGREDIVLDSGFLPDQCIAKQTKGITYLRSVSQILSLLNLDPFVHRCPEIGDRKYTISPLESLDQGCLVVKVGCDHLDTLLGERLSSGLGSISSDSSVLELLTSGGVGEKGSKDGTSLFAGGSDDDNEL